MHAPELNWEYSKREKRNGDLIWTSFSARLSIRWKGNKWGMHFRKFCQSLPNISPLLLLVWEAENGENWGSCSRACPYPTGHQSYLGGAANLQILFFCTGAYEYFPPGHPAESASPPNLRTPSATLSLAFFRPPNKGDHLLRSQNLLLGLICISYNVELGFFFFLILIIYF